MFCNKCGHQLKDGATFCNNCGNLAKSAGAVPSLQSTVQNTYTTAVAPYNPTTPQAGGAATTAKKTIKINRKTATLAAAIIVMIVGVSITFNTVQENRRQELAAAEAAAEAAEQARLEAEEAARIEAEFTAIENRLDSYANAVTSGNTEYADEFWVVGGRGTKQFFDSLGSIDSVKVGGSSGVDIGINFNLGGLVDSGKRLINDLINYTYKFGFERSDITLKGEKATINATLSITHTIEKTRTSSGACTIVMVKQDDKWLIENIED